MKDTFTDPAYVQAFQRHRTLPKDAMEFWVRNIVDASHSELEPPRVIDACSGWGRFCIPVAAQLISAGSVLALDYSPQMIDECKRLATENHLANINFACGDILTYEMVGKASVVFISSALHVFHDLTPLFRTFRDWLLPGGSLIIRSPSHEQWKNIEWLNWFDGLVEAGLARTPGTPQIIDCLKASGFTNVVMTEVDESLTFSDRAGYVAPLLDRAYSILRSLTRDEIQQRLDQFVPLANGSVWKHSFASTCIKASIL